MHRALRRPVFTFMLASLTVGCAGLAINPKCPCVTGPKAQVDENAPDLNKQRLTLSEGYSLLYADAIALDRAELILYVKGESEEVDKMVTSLTEFGGELKRDLEKIAKDYPGVRIDLDPLPEMEKRKRLALGKDRALYFAPVIGHGGREYERTVLLAFSNAVNHERYMCQVMAEEEPVASLKKFLIDTKKRYDDLYDRTIALLDREYFKNPNGPTSE
jgi:hypothetical protein